MDKLDIYNRLPVFAQNIACYYKGRQIRKKRYSKKFWKLLTEYEKRSNWSYEQLCDYRDTKLRQMIKHSYNTVAYYRNLFNKLGIHYEDIKTLEDLSLLPILNKQTIIDNFNDFISKSINSREIVISHTSGTTGSGFRFYTTEDAISEQWAVWWRYRRNLGISFSKWCAHFGSQLIVPVSHNKPPFWRINEPNKQIYFSAFHENDDNLYYYYKVIKKRQLKWVHGFPSLITLLAAFIINNNLNLGYKVDIITIGAENLLEFQQKIIEKAFGTKVFQHYGLAEGVSNFSETKSGEILIDEDFAITELIPDGETYRIIGTNLTNYSMPLIRYDTQDTATYQFDKKSGKRVITSIDGRKEDYITLPNGTKVGKLDHAFKDTINFKEVQLYQDLNYNIKIFAVKRESNISNDEKIAMELLRKSLGWDISIEFKYVDKIKPTSGGKLRFVKSEIK